MFVRQTFVALAMLGIAATPSAANAKPRYVTVSTAVSYTDLDLGTARGQRKLDRRVVRAAVELCRANDQDVLIDAIDEMRCQRAAIEGARAQVTHVLLNHGKTQRAAR